MVKGKDFSRGLRQAYMLMHRQTQRLLSGHHVTTDQYVLLAHLSIQDGITQNELTTRASSDPNTIRAMLVLLENKGLLVRKPHESDRRARKVLLTAKGRRLYDKLALVLEPLQDALMSPFSAQEAKQFVDGLQRVENAMQQWELAQPSLLGLHGGRRNLGNHEALPAAGARKKEATDMNKK